MSMNENERSEEFSVHIELGKKPNEGNGPAMVSPAGKDGKKPKVYYPTLYLSDIKGLDQLPKEGCALIDFKVVSTTSSMRDGKESTSCELEIHTLCLQPDGGDGEKKDEYGDTESAIDAMAKKAGIDTGGDSEEEASESPEEEAGEDEEKE